MTFPLRTEERRGEESRREGNREEDNIGTPNGAPSANHFENNFDADKASGGNPHTPGYQEETEGNPMATYERNGVPCDPPPPTQEERDRAAVKLKEAKAKLQLASEEMRPSRRVTR